MLIHTVIINIDFSEKYSVERQYGPVSLRQSLLNLSPLIATNPSATLTLLIFAKEQHFKEVVWVEQTNFGKF